MMTHQIYFIIDLIRHMRVMNSLQRKRKLILMMRLLTTILLKLYEACIMVSLKLVVLNQTHLVLLWDQFQKSLHTFHQFLLQKLHMRQIVLILRVRLQELKLLMVDKDINLCLALPQFPVLEVRV